MPVIMASFNGMKDLIVFQLLVAEMQATFKSVDIRKQARIQ